MGQLITRVLTITVYMNKKVEVRSKEQNWNNASDEMRMPWEPGCVWLCNFSKPNLSLLLPSALSNDIRYITTEYIFTVPQ